MQGVRLDAVTAQKYGLGGILEHCHLGPGSLAHKPLFTRRDGIGFPGLMFLMIQVTSGS